jgi:hypothetical protein
MISPINTSLVELYFEDTVLDSATAVLCKEGLLVENARVGKAGVIRRAYAYDRGYFRPLRQAVFQGLDVESITAVLRHAEELAGEEADKVKRRQRLHQVKTDIRLFLREESPMDEGVLPKG